MKIELSQQVVAAMKRSSQPVVTIWRFGFLRETGTFRSSAEFSSKRAGGEFWNAPKEPTFAGESLDQVNVKPMKTMLVSEFETKCIAILKEVERSNEAVIVTLRGRPLARVEPFAKGAPKGKQLEALKGRMHIRRDLTRQDTSGDWEMLK